MQSSAVSDVDRKLAELPAKFGQYSVVRELGRGGMACVYEGRHPHLGSRVALKVMNAGLAAQAVAASRFLREGKAAAQIRHQNVVEVFDIGTEDGVPFIVMEFLDGTDLATLLAQKGTLPVQGIVDIFLPVLSAVAAAHRVGVIHRDLKPANLVLTRRTPGGTHPMVLDFGISKIVNDEPEGTLTRSESLLGTVQYMAPELTKGARFATPASDQYAIGVMLYECATGQRPFGGGSYYELMHAIVTAPITPPSEIRPSLPPELERIILRAMSRDPAERFASVQALGSELLPFGSKKTWALWEQEFLVGDTTGSQDPWSPDGGTISDEPQLSAGTRPARTPRQRSGRLAFALVGIYALLVTVALLVAVLFWRRTSDISASASPPSSSVPTSTVEPVGPPGNGPLPVAPPRPLLDLDPPAARPEAESVPSQQSAQKLQRKPPPFRKSIAPSPSTSIATPVSGAAEAPKSHPMGANDAPIVE